MTMALLEGQIAIVTGASRGIGGGAALALARAGAGVGLIARNATALSELEATIRGQGVGKVSLRVADVADPVKLRHAVESLSEELGPPSILVNNAGAIDRTATEEMTEESWRRVFDTNVGGAVTAARAVLPSMKELGGGSIINVASLSAHFGVRRASSYGASKSALLGLTRALALEWAPHHIRVNAITPGYIATDFTAKLTQNSERTASILARIPLGRWGSPQDIAGTVVYLGSSLSDYVTGQVVVVDGGYSIDG
ncbi:glucose 1-dehydrogenase [Rhodococcus sp. IEGM 1381]|uniref:SDR family NAD(P)-dependent oxidoreductase n=1 Tax=Rhodococcus sp. IEGM 1381 TaxID=3047085 RepID=UPI0024B75E19|nr:glucose 1-dehydrogenase [Rhodococcus sp. IEGM 1381]MDI9897404.1 glucose 1-dehydrogenase [Rhodococcus sp. IEGM 1381]